MTQVDPPPFVLNTAALKRAWLGAPLAMTCWLVLLAYLVAWIIAAQMAGSEFANLPTRSKYLAHGTGWYFAYRIGWLTPLWWGLGVSAIGFVFGAIGMSMAEQRTQSALGFTFLEATHPLTQRVHRMAEKLDLPAPRVGIMGAVNAFAVGTTRHDASVILGRPLVNGLNPDELDAVIGHELGHIASGDMRRTLFAEGYQNLFGAVASMIGIILTVLLQVALKHGQITGSGASLVHQLGKLGRITLGAGSEFFVKSSSRKREFYADAVGAAMSSPAAMSRALQRLGGLTEKASPAESKYAYLMIRGFSGSAFSTHPSTEDRVAALASGTYLQRMTAAHAERQHRKARAQAAARSAVDIGAAGAHSAGKAALAAVQKARSSRAETKRAAVAAPLPAPRPTSEKNRQRLRIEPTF